MPISKNQNLFQYNTSLGLTVKKTQTLNPIYLGLAVDRPQFNLNVLFIFSNSIRYSKRSCDVFLVSTQQRQPLICPIYNSQQNLHSEKAFFQIKGLLPLFQLFFCLATFLSSSTNFSLQFIDDNLFQHCLQLDLYKFHFIREADLIAFDILSGCIKR